MVTAVPSIWRSKPLIDAQLWEAIKTQRPMFCGVMILWVVVASAGLGFAWSIRPIPFSSTLWKEHENERPRMVGDLLENHDLTGLSEAEIGDLLGTPSSQRGRRYIYWAGYAGIDDMWLDIEFNDGRVSSVRHIPD